MFLAWSEATAQTHAHRDGNTLLFCCDHIILARGNMIFHSNLDPRVHVKAPKHRCCCALTVACACCSVTLLVGSRSLLKFLCLLKLLQFQWPTLLHLNHQLFSCLYFICLMLLWKVLKLETWHGSFSNWHSLLITTLLNMTHLPGCFCFSDLVDLNMILVLMKFFHSAVQPPYGNKLCMCLICYMRRLSVTALGRKELSHMVCINVTLNTHDKTKCS